ncbi:hypothetical protein HKX48_002085 [Thoreauomyces humboldtii]|nr:hypothetical protein HKX48_002085 [Thoreauomyces humboldtii]
MASKPHLIPRVAYTSDTGSKRRSVDIQSEQVEAHPSDVRSILNSATAFKNLWSLSLANCHALPLQLLSGLSEFVAFGLLDLSYTPINFKTLQRTFRHVRLLSLRCIGCPRIESAEGGPERRGFTVLCLPDMWMLDGVFITWDERKTWRANGSGVASGDVRTRFLDLADRELMPFTSGFATSEAKTPRDGSRSGRSRPGDPASTEAPTAVQRIWSRRASALLENVPYEFEMGVEQDMARLRVLARNLELDAAVGFAGTVKNPGIVDGTVTAVLMGEASVRGQGEGQRPKDAHGIGSRTILALILLGSLASQFKQAALQRTVETIFILSWDVGTRLSGGVDHWARAAASPVHWRLNDRMMYLALLIGKLTLDSISETSVRDRPPLLPPDKLRTFCNVLQYTLKASYAITNNQPSKSQADVHKVAALATSLMPEAHAVKLSELHLDILQLLCLDDQGAREFCSGAPDLCAALSESLDVLLPAGHALRAEARSIAADAALRRDVGVETATALSLEAHALQLKFRLCSTVEKAAAILERSTDDLAPSAIC